MKKVIQIILLTTVFLSLQACGEKKKVDTTNPQSPNYINHNDDKPMP
jgi:predicted small lipoprotein YifL